MSKATYLDATPHCDAVAAGPLSNDVREWRELAEHLERLLRDREKGNGVLRTKLNRATKVRDEAYAKSTKALHDAKSAIKGLERYKIDGGRYQWLRGIGVRFPGSGEGYLHDHDADRTVDQGMKIDSYPPSLTEVAATHEPHRRWRDPLNPALPLDLAQRLSLSSNK